MFLSSRSSVRRARLAIVVAAGLLAAPAGLIAPTPARAATGVTAIGTATKGSSSSKNSITVKRPDGTEPGQVMVAAIVSNDDDGDFTAPAGWSVVREDTVPGKLRQAVYVKVAEAPDPAAFTWKVSEW